jgi:hypothetical protein
MKGGDLVMEEEHCCTCDKLIVAPEGVYTDNGLECDKCAGYPY